MSLDRREFHKITLAALSGLAAGAAGCEAKKQQPQSTTGTDVNPQMMSVPGGSTTPAVPTAGEGTEVALHTCRGLNACKGQGAGKDNSCAGQGTCATVKAHDCAAMNECKGQGGCGENPAANECKGKGGCHVPLMDDAWTKARAAFEAKMKEAGKEVGAAPAKA
jgi:hypothetical protein